MGRSLIHGAHWSQTTVQSILKYPHTLLTCLFFLLYLLRYS